MDIHDNQARHCFETEIDGCRAFLDYRRAGRTLFIQHTEVPSALGGRGVGSALVRHACDVASSEGLKVVSHCSFATRWIEKNT